MLRNEILVEAGDRLPNSVQECLGNQLGWAVGVEVVLAECGHVLADLVGEAENVGERSPGALLESHTATALWTGPSPQHRRR